jgi:endonuclease YncB( thermonuclease family)
MKVYIFIIVIFIGYLIIRSNINENKRKKEIIHSTDILLGETTGFNNQSYQKVFCNRVIDGDTIVIDNGKKVRFANIDAYEKNSPIHNDIMNFLIPLIEGRMIYIDIKGIDKYKRQIGIIYTLDGVNVNYELVVNGYARVYDQYCDKSSEFYKNLKKAESHAKMMLIGGFGLGLNSPWFDRHNN